VQTANAAASTSTPLQRSRSYEREDWLLDTGSTHHLCNNKDFLHNYEAFANKGTVIFANGESTCCFEGEGDVCMVTSGEELVWVRGVLYAPEISQNIFSPPFASPKGFTFHGEEGELWDEVRSPEGHLLSKLTTSVLGDNRQYMDVTMLTAEVVAFVNTMFTDKLNALELLHRRMGHLGIESLSRLVKEEMVAGISIPKVQLTQWRECDICLQAKQVKPSFGRSTSYTSRALELVHSDTMGPMKTASLGGHKYIVTFLDDCTRYAEVVPILNLSEVAKVVKFTLNKWATQKGVSVMRFRSRSSQALLPP
jgi:hypothetical protein